jgi:hypothetical protein
MGAAVTMLPFDCDKSELPIAFVPVYISKSPTVPLPVIGGVFWACAITAVNRTNTARAGRITFMFLSPFFTLSNLDTYTSKRLLRANHECRVRSERRKRQRHREHTCSSPYSSRMALAGYGKSAWPRRKITTDPFRAQDADRKPKLVYGIERTLPRDRERCLYLCRPQGAGRAMDNSAFRGAIPVVCTTRDGRRCTRPSALCRIRSSPPSSRHVLQRVSRHKGPGIADGLLRHARNICPDAASRGLALRSSLQ